MVVAVLGMAYLPSLNSASATATAKKPQTGIVTGSIAFYGRPHPSGSATAVEVLRDNHPVAGATVSAGRPYRFALPPGTYLLVAREDVTGEIGRRLVTVRSGETTHANVSSVFH